jgi:intracellular multiplication protein IcmB
MRFLDNLVSGSLDIISIMSPIHTYEYCQIETRASADNDHTYSCTDGGYLSSLSVSGINKVIGTQEVNDALIIFGKIIDLMTEHKAHELDYEYIKNPLETRKHLHEFFEPQKNTANRIGMDMDDQFNESQKALTPNIFPELNTIYIKTNPTALNNQTAYRNKIKAAYKEILAHVRIKESQKAWLYSEDLLTIHDAAVKTVKAILESAGFSVELNDLSETFQSMRSSATGKFDTTSQPKLWGDKPNLKVTLEDNPREPNLFNFGMTSMGIQILPFDIETTSEFGIVKVDDLYIAPLLIETIPDNPNSNFLDFLATIPAYMPLKYRCTVKNLKTQSQAIASTLAPFLSFSDKYLRHNQNISNGFEKIEAMVRSGRNTPNVQITLSTWSTDIVHVKQLRQELISKIASWEKATCTIERGNAKEAFISTVAGFSSMNLAPATLETCVNIAKLTPFARPASPFHDGHTMLYHPSGKPFPYSPTSKQLESFIEIDLAPSGSGKSVFQGAVNRDSSLKPGMKELVRHTTLDIGVSGKGTVRGIQDSLPENMKHQAVYEKVIMDVHYAINPMDLHLGALKPTPPDRVFVNQFITLLVTPKGHEIRRMMPEMIEMLVESAYKQCADPESAKLYTSKTNSLVDDALAQYSENNDRETWGRRKTWNKVKDFLFSKGHIREAKVAGRYSVPLIPELPSFAQQDMTIKSQYDNSSNNDMTMLGEFTQLISAASREYELLTQPTRVDYDDAKYIVLDLNDVTQEEGSKQTAVMYALAAHVGTRDFWLGPDYINTFEKPYREHVLETMTRLNEQERGVTFEEFRRTKGQPNLRAMISRWMAEGRKWGVSVRIVAQQPEHLDIEMIRHASVVCILGAWTRIDVSALSKLLALSESEMGVLSDGTTHGPKKGGSSMLIKYRLKGAGWGAQVVKLAKSGSELWAASTTLDDMSLRERVETLVGNTVIARNILTLRYPGGSASEEIKRERNRMTQAGSGDSDVLSTIAKKAIDSWKMLKE